jgi:hypothetical protein
MFELESAYLDVAAIEEGRWQELGADFPGVAILARGLTAPGAKAMEMKLMREAPKKDRIFNGQLTEEALNRIRKKVVIEKCILDWRGLSSGGKPLPFSKETLEGIMNEPRARKIAAAMVQAILDLEQTIVAAEDDIVGNSPAS